MTNALRSRGIAPHTVPTTLEARLKETAHDHA